MSAAVRLRADYSAPDLRRLGRASTDSNQSAHLLPIAAIVEGRIREEPVRIGGMDLQTLHDWVYRFKKSGPSGFLDRHGNCAELLLWGTQLSELVGIAEAGPNPEWAVAFGGGRLISSAS